MTVVVAVQDRAGSRAALREKFGQRADAWTGVLLRPAPS
jgi:hypothetical protein